MIEPCDILVSDSGMRSLAVTVRDMAITGKGSSKTFTIKASKRKSVERIANELEAMLKQRSNSATR